MLELSGEKGKKKNEFFLFRNKSCIYVYGCVYYKVVESIHVTMSLV